MKKEQYNNLIRRSLLKRERKRVSILFLRNLSCKYMRISANTRKPQTTLTDQFEKGFAEEQITLRKSGISRLCVCPTSVISLNFKKGIKHTYFQVM